MTKGRLEAFSDGVMAILITIMVLDFKIPHEASLTALHGMLSVFLSYVLSYVFLGIYWNNHHHLMHAVHKVNGPILWANLHLLFWLSLIPFATAWMGENCFGGLPVALYGVVLLFAAIAYYILTRALLHANDSNSALARAVGRDGKGKISVYIYAIAIALAMYRGWIACLLYVFVACMWLVPDRRIEDVLADERAGS